MTEFEKWKAVLVGAAALGWTPPVPEVRFLDASRVGWERAWAEVHARCDQTGLSWQYMESWSDGHRFRQRTSDGGPNRWYTVAPREDDFDPVEVEAGAQ